jgi:hypothetical protein
MAAVTEEQAAELLGLMVRMYARQMATLKLARTLSGISELEIDETIAQAMEHLHRIPLVHDALIKKDLSQIHAVVKSLESVAVDQW